MVILLIFSIFSIYWGALWKTPVGGLEGWIVDFDADQIGTSISRAILSPPSSDSSSIPSGSTIPASTRQLVKWTQIPASRFPGGPAQLAHEVLEEKVWVGVAINPNSTSRYLASLSNPNASYAGTDAMTVYAVEARNENAYRSLIRPYIQTSFAGVTASFASQAARQLASNSTSLGNVLATSPQTLTAPVGYTIHNLAPFDVPVASAVTFVGLLYQLIISFFVVMISTAARETSQLQTLLTTRSLIILRFGSSFLAYFVLSLFYCLLSVAFQLPLTRKFGHAGFVVFWMLNYAGMLSVGLALEAMLTLLTVSFIAFFMLTWIIANVAVCIFPLEVLPSIYRYGYAAPFYNVSQAMRTIIFGTKNRVGFHFAILIVWIVISCFTLPLIQILVRRREVRRVGINTVVGEDGSEVKREEEREMVALRERDGPGQ
ncbi:hypothetical protein BDQ12DRAFT_688429 [Crucibulum laeve]|uniref:DUF3533 domain-containing protein n=1 Tax=Crucibulum laeve TaxID=68775 RepID=A0A5C3LQT5_9AGAR|nr:hypothetical protein BDQ12DRAFT_688429 [Crucibulum laeve]